MKPWTPGTPRIEGVATQGLTLHSAEKLGNQLITYAAVPAQVPGCRYLAIPTACTLSTSLGVNDQNNR